MARRFKASPSAPRAGDLVVFERLLDNGLRALILPRKRVPIVVCDLFYPVGSFDEPPGKTGLAHFVEHMLFKGTERFPKGQIDQLAFLAGGQANAETGEDFTHYWFTFPSGRWEIALQVEADRMRGAHFDPSEVEAERKVIGEERARELESPQARLDQAHQALSYLRHPYRNPVLGWQEDVAAIRVDDLRRFTTTITGPTARCWCWPVTSIRRGRWTGSRRCLPRSRQANVSLASEPGISPASRAGVISRCWSPTSCHAGCSAGIPCRASIATPSRLTSWPTCSARVGARGSGRPWWEKEKLATWVEALHAPARRAGQFFVQVDGIPGQDPALLEQRIIDVIGEIAAQGPTTEELVRARNRLEAGWRWEQEDLSGLAAGIGHASLWGNWRDWQAEHAAALQVDAAAIVKVIARYLSEANLTAGWSLPRPRRGRAAAALAGDRSPNGRAAEPETKAARSPHHSIVPPGPAKTPAALDEPPGRPAIDIPHKLTKLIDYRPRAGGWIVVCA